MGPIGGAIGGYVGGVIDPTQINGPHIGDGQRQTSEDGVPIPWILGTAPCTGNICMSGPRYEVKKTQGGKGDTTQTNTFEAHQSFAIQICESCDLRDSTIVGILIVRQNGKIVYDVRPESNFMAESAKWAEKVTFYFGGEDQLPDPTMEAIFGVGNTPAMRGSCYAVFRDFNRSEFGDAIPQFDWVVVSEGTVAPASTVYRPGRLSRFTNNHFPLADPLGNYDYTGYWVDGTGGGHTSPTFATIEEVQQYFVDLAAVPALGTPDNFIGYAGRTDFGVGGPYDSTEDFDVTGTQPDVTDLESVILLYQWIVPDGWTTSNGNSMCGDTELGGPWLGAVNGTVVRKVSSHSTVYLDMALCGSDHLEGIYPVCISATRKRMAPVINGVAIPDLPGWYVDPDGNLFSGYSEVVDTFHVLAEATLQSVAPGADDQEYAYYENGPAVRIGDPNYSDSAFWDAALAAAIASGTLPADFAEFYPATVDSAWLENSGDLPLVASGTIPLSTIVQRINRRGGLTDADIDVSELTDLVIGYPIVGQYTAADCIRPLAGCYFFKGSEYDAQIHFHKDGADATFVVDPQDFINGEDEKDEDKRGQAKEYPRLLTGSYIDPTLDFAIGKSKAERRSPDVRAIGEAQLQIPVVMNPDPAWQATEKALKVMWAKQLGTRKFSVPYAVGSKTYLKMVPCMPFGLEGKRYVVDQITLEDGQMLIEASYDRQSAFTSNATAAPTLAPTPPRSTIYGPTILAAMNAPRLRSKDNSPGMYLAACGVLDSWPGCMVQISLDDGETFSDAIKIDIASVMGNLTGSVSAEGSDAEPVPVSIYNGELTNATDAQLSNGVNGFAMIDDDDVLELAQFKTQDETSPKRYNLSEVTRGGLGTAVVDHASGERFVMMSNVVFLPLNADLAGRTIIFRPVTFGTDPALTATYSVVFRPQFSGPVILEYLLDETGARLQDETGAYLLEE
jgi:hypothetical protein